MERPAAPPARPLPVWTRQACSCEAAPAPASTPDPNAVALGRALWVRDAKTASGITADMASRYSLDTFDPSLHPSILDAFEDILAWIDAPARKGRLLYGPTGCGKTHLCVGVGQALLDRGVSVLYTTAADLLDELRASYRDGGEEHGRIFRYAQRVSVLILDDLGAERIARGEAGDWVREQLFRLVDARERARLPILGGTNLTPQDLQDHIGGIAGERIVSRLHAIAEFRPVNGPDGRMA